MMRFRDRVTSPSYSRRPCAVLSVRILGTRTVFRIFNHRGCEAEAPTRYSKERRELLLRKLLSAETCANRHNRLL
jgi:hypothetical protein